MNYLQSTGKTTRRLGVELIDNGNGTTTFIQSEVFRGMLVSLFKKQLDNNTTNGFNAMNQWLKKLVEKDILS